MDNLPKLIDMHYGSATDAVTTLNMQPVDIRKGYLEFQHYLYMPSGPKSNGVTVNLYHINNQTTNNYDNSNHLTINQ